MSENLNFDLLMALDEKLRDHHVFTIYPLGKMHVYAINPVVT